jgi:hypothetical protein
MPRYAASCDDKIKCGRIFDYFSSIANRNKCLDKCPDCGSSAHRDIAAELACMGDFNGTCKSNPRWSWSMGVPASQVNEFRKRFPNSVYSDDGRLLVKSRQDKLRQAKERHMCELD